MKLYHQCGHNSVWNFNALEKNQLGDGLIISPVHEKLQRVEKLSSIIRKQSIFDPQYYLPNSQKTKLQTYKFFPEALTHGFTTVEFSLVALESAKLCLDFQNSQLFERIIIPSRYFKDMVSDYVTQQEIYSVVPFLKEIGRQKIKKPVFLTLALTSAMILDTPYRTGILNWVTSFSEISGVYLIVDHERSTKQIDSEAFLLGMLGFMTELRRADLKIIVGYTNTESILYTLVGDIDLTMGAYENTRMFSLDKFIESDEERRGPKARIYLPGLLNWIQFGQAKELRSEDDDLWNSCYTATEHAEAVLEQAAEPTFNQAPLYLHYFNCFESQVNELRSLDQLQRFKQISQWLKEGLALDEAISDLPIALERHGKGSHLQAWLNVTNAYYRRYLKT